MEDEGFRLLGFGKAVWLALVFGIVLGLLVAPAISPLLSGKQQKGDVIRKIAHLTSGASESELTLSVTLENVRESKMRFRIVLTAPSSLVKIDPTNVTSDPMAPGETREYSFSITAPEAASGDYQVVITAFLIEAETEQAQQTEEAWFKKEGMRLRWSQVTPERS